MNGTSIHVEENIKTIPASSAIWGHSKKATYVLWPRKPAFNPCKIGQLSQFLAISSLLNSKKNVRLYFKPMIKPKLTKPTNKSFVLLHGYRIILCTSGTIQDCDPPVSIPKVQVLDLNQTDCLSRQWFNVLFLSSAVGFLFLYWGIWLQGKSWTVRYPCPVMPTVK